LGELGYDKVAHLDGGLKAWKEQGRPVEHNT
jgi:3-mercaptopyruvate sulfurtransferase SseA